MKKLSQIRLFLMASVVLVGSSISLDAKMQPPPPMPRPPAPMVINPELRAPADRTRPTTPALRPTTPLGDRAVGGYTPPPTLMTPKLGGKAGEYETPHTQAKQPASLAKPAPTYAPAAATYQVPKPSVKDPKSFSFLQKIFSPLKYQQAKKEYANYQHFQSLYQNQEKLDRAKTGAQTLLHQASLTRDPQQISIAQSSAERKIRQSEEMAAAQKTGDQYAIDQVVFKHQRENKAAVEAVNQDRAIGTRVAQPETVPYTGQIAEHQGKPVPLGVPQRDLQPAYWQERALRDAAQRPVQTAPAPQPVQAPAQ
ncbi:hypothetical protein K2X40_01765 [Candidatus Babeliales bacterium]|nr:hypothetical protein [Candidatus Babeliales bacterium]